MSYWKIIKSFIKNGFNQTNDFSVFTNILVINEANLGNLILSTPVSSALKANFQVANITYLMKPEYKDLLLSMCPYIDEAIDCSLYDDLEKKISLIESFSPDLIVDLFSLNELSLSWFSNAKYLKFVKPDLYSGNIKHLVRSYLDTIIPICPIIPKPFFPTLFPESVSKSTFAEICQKYNLDNKPIIGIVAGINPNYPSRGWISEAWSYVIDNILHKYNVTPVLIGFDEERTSCEVVRMQVDGNCVNLAGLMDLAELAVFISHCELIIAPDTGINHLAVAIGKPTIGLYGPTPAYFTGPFGGEHLVLDQSRSCECHEYNTCKVAALHQPGKCMNRIMVPEVLDKIAEVLNSEYVLKLENNSN